MKRRWREYLKEEERESECTKEENIRCKEKKKITFCLVEKMLRHGK